MYCHTGIYFPGPKIGKIHKHRLNYKILEEEYSNSSSEQKQPPEVLYKRAALKTFAISLRKTPVLESLFSNVADLQACNVIKKIPQYGWFPVNIAKSLRAAILKIICRRLLLPLELFCKDLVDISYENVSFSILEESIWLTPIYFLTKFLHFGL